MRKAHCLFLALLPIGGCQDLVKVEVECPRLCLGAPGPALSTLLPAFPTYPIDAAIPAIPFLLDASVSGWPGFNADVDGGLPAYPDGGVEGPLNPLDGPALVPSDSGVPCLTPTWSVEIPFNQVLAQLPTTAVDLSTTVKLTSLRLAGTADLSFIETVEVFLTRGKARADGGAIPADVKLDASSAEVCKSVGETILVASYAAPGTITPSPILDLRVLRPKLDVFRCLEKSPAQFHVRMGFRLSAAAAALESPLTLHTCIQAEACADFP